MDAAAANTAISNLTIDDNNGESDPTIDANSAKAPPSPTSVQEQQQKLSPFQQFKQNQANINCNSDEASSTATTNSNLQTPITTPTPNIANPIAPPKFQGRPNIQLSNQHQFQTGLSPREKLQRGAASAGAKVLENSTPFRKNNNNDDNASSDRSSPRLGGIHTQSAVHTPSSPSQLQASLPPSFTPITTQKTEEQNNNNPTEPQEQQQSHNIEQQAQAAVEAALINQQQSEAMKQLTNIFSPEQAMAIQAAIQSIMTSKTESPSQSSSDIAQKAMLAAAMAGNAAKQANEQRNSSASPTTPTTKPTAVAAAASTTTTIPQPKPSLYNPQKSSTFQASLHTNAKPFQPSAQRQPSDQPIPGTTAALPQHYQAHEYNNPYAAIGGSSTAGIPSYMLQNAFSRKVFVGGLPPDIDEDEIRAHFSKFGKLSVDWPHKAESKSIFPPKGYAFLLFQSEDSVHKLVTQCQKHENKYYMMVNSPTIKEKQVQIRPWLLSDSDYVMDSSEPLDPRKTIFVGGVPRPLRASELAEVMNHYYGAVCYAGIDTDPELKYPKGAGRVAFSNQQSYIAAISARFVQLKHGEIDKRVEVKPYVLDDQLCDECQGQRNNGKFAPYFCANITCLQYYCENCWKMIHSLPGREFHKPLVKEGAERNGLSSSLSALTNHHQHSKGGHGGHHGQMPPTNRSMGDVMSSGPNGMHHGGGGGGFHHTPTKNSIGATISSSSSAGVSPRARHDRPEMGAFQSSRGPMRHDRNMGGGGAGGHGNQYDRGHQYGGGHHHQQQHHHHQHHQHQDHQHQPPDLSSMSLQQAAAAAAAWQKQQQGHNKNPWGPSGGGGGQQQSGQGASGSIGSWGSAPPERWGSPRNGGDDSNKYSGGGGGGGGWGSSGGGGSRNNEWGAPQSQQQPKNESFGWNPATSYFSDSANNGGGAGNGGGGGGGQWPGNSGSSWGM